MLRVLIVTFGILGSVSCSDSSSKKQLTGTVETQNHLNIEASKITVSGISSGGYMASQYHIAYSQQVNGAALLASGPYGCAQGDLKIALSNCMNISADMDIQPLYKNIIDQAEKSTIDTPTHLAEDRVWIFHGENDQTVGRKVVNAQKLLYDKFGATIQQQFELKSGHGFPTIDKGVECSQTKSPFINQCGVDVVSQFMTFLYPSSLPKKEPNSTGGLQTKDKLIEFDQSLFVEDNTLADKGYLFVPEDCFNGQRCGVHVAFHGCQQNVDSIGMQFIQDVGINQWASANHLVVLYPQTKASYLPLNPKACWDWWGYTGEGYLTKTGVQLKHINNMVKNIALIINQG